MLSQQQIDSFHSQGFLVMPGVVRGRELAQLREESAAVVAQGVAKDGNKHLYHQLEDGGEVYWRSEDLWNRHAIFRAVAVNPELLENIGQCVGQAFFPWNDSLVVKIPGGRPVTWHQDPPYGDPARLSSGAVPNFTTDIYLDESDEGNGCVWAIPGHHLVGHVKLEDKSQEELFARCGAVPVRMKPGDVLFHCLSTPHGSMENPSNRMRRTFYIHYIAQQAFDECGYAPWGKPAWGEAKRAQVAQMARDRAALGLDAAFGPAIREVADGLEFTGPVRTPRGHWPALAARIPSDRRAELKELSVGGLRPPNIGLRPAPREETGRADGEAAQSSQLSALGSRL